MSNDPKQVEARQIFSKYSRQSSVPKLDSIRKVELPEPKSKVLRFRKRQTLNEKKSFDKLNPSSLHTSAEKIRESKDNESSTGNDTNDNH